MPQFHVDSEAVLAATAAVQGSIGSIQAEVAALNGHLTGLQNSWGGSASLAFQNVVADWRGTQQRVEESLAGINQALAAAGRQYAEIEQANLRLFGR